MILPWMLYASVTSLLVALAALILEGAVRQRRWPIRGLWVMALATSLTLPLLGAALPPDRDSPAPSAGPAGEPSELSSAAPVSRDWIAWTEPLSAVAAVPGERRDVDPWLLSVWGITSLGIALGLALSYRSLARRRGGWVRQKVNGRTIWVSEDTGPAVVGFLPGHIVLPEWVCGASATEREIVLTHEEEHVRAWDPALILGALLIWIAMPWNVGLLLISRRLRRAVEIDCDLRVLARGVDPRAYSRLLVEVMERGTAHRMAVAALSESPSFLERRIRLMLTPDSRWSSVRAVVSLLLAFAPVLAACQVDRPERAVLPVTGATYVVGADGALEQDRATSPVPELDSTVTELELSHAPAAAIPATSAAASLDPFRAAMRTAIEEFYPNLLSEDVPGDRVNLYFLATGSGQMQRTAIDSEERSGSCGGILQSGLGIEVDWTASEASGCMRFLAGQAGPNDIHIFWASLKSQPGDASPPGPYRFAEIASRSRPAEGVLRSAVQRHHPEVLEAGLPIGETLWFIVDGAARVIHAGRGPVYGSSRIAAVELERMHPGLDIGPVLMSSQVRAETGERIRLIWATVTDAGSAADPGRAVGAAPEGEMPVFTITSPTPGEPVRIRLTGEAARDPSAFRIDGRFERDGNDLVARTPFLFIVVSPGAFEGSFSPDEPGVELTARAVDGEVRMSGERVIFRRAAQGEEIVVESDRIIEVAPGVQR